MNRADFEHELEAQGYREVIDRRMQAGEFNPEHAHEFDARLLVLEGEMTIVCDGEERTYRSGDTFAMRELVTGAPVLSKLATSIEVCQALSDVLN